MRTEPRVLGTADLGLIEAAFDDLVGCPFFIKNARLEYVAANAAMLELCGANNKDELIGTTSVTFFPPQLARQYEVLDKEILSSGKRISNIVDITEGKTRLPSWIVFSRSPVFDRHGGVVGILASGRKIGSAKGKTRGITRLRTAVNRLKKNFTKPFDLSEISENLEISPSQIQRDFQKYLGMSPRQFQVKLRIDYATKLLTRSESVAEIAYACGFVDQSSFARCFKKQLGLTPSRYRQLLQT